MILAKRLNRLNWHDLVFAVGGIFLSASLVPALWGAITVPAWAALFAVITLTAFAVNYFTMKLYWSTSMAVVQVLLWILVLIHSI